MRFKKHSKMGIQMLAFSLTVLAGWFAQMPCWGRIYEPQMPEQLKKGI